ncbi:MAG: uracil-DNA glycosylase [Candidatus Doudnabacteria bacterium]|nr:uracil-DNA glycosylase [Candidatus Doudnabacteria bacterium]
MTISELHQRCIDSGKYPLFPGASRLVPGHGNPHAKLMFIGEAPGADEDKNGIPFVGRAGKFLDELLGSIGLKREDIYITNMVKCRPPGNRDPEDREIALYRAWLDWEIKLIEPQVFVPLGRFAMAKFLPGLKISQVHGKAFRRLGKIYFVMYHPAVALYKGSMREVMLEDIKLLKDILAGDESKVEDLVTAIDEVKALLHKDSGGSDKSEPPDDSDKQLSLI